MERVLEPAELKSSLEILLGLSTMTLATTGPGGEAHAADVYFASDAQLNLFFFSAAESQHGSDIHREPRAAATIHAAGDQWEQILGLQMRGNCIEISAPTEWQQAWDVYLAKFPFVSDLEEVIKVNQLYGFTPKWIRLVDNNQGFGYKQEWQLNEAVRGGRQVRQWAQYGIQGRESGRANG
jgi:uncharacterized protein YhbP (UPF0306 family)